MTLINIDGVDYDTEKLSEAAKANILSISFVNEQILQLNNEMQIAETAKIGYSRALKREIEKI